MSEKDDAIANFMLTKEQLDTVLTDAERSQAIVSVCSLDRVIEMLLRSTMIDDEAVNDLMNEDRGLSSFSIKMKLAYGLGLIPKILRDDLRYINKIRNRLAHEMSAASFADVPILDWCHNLSTARTPKGEWVDCATAYGLAVKKSFWFMAYEAMERQRGNTSGRKQELEALQARYDHWVDPFDLKISPGAIADRGAE